MLCMPDTGKVTTTLQRSLRDLARIEWAKTIRALSSIPPSASCSAVLWESGFEVSDIVEVYVPDGAADHPQYDSVPAQ